MAIVELVKNIDKFIYFTLLIVWIIIKIVQAPRFFCNIYGLPCILSSLNCYFPVMHDSSIICLLTNTDSGMDFYVVYIESFLSVWTV
jgi:hypothetical protein